MTRDLSAVARLANGVVVGDTIPTNTLIDDALALDEFTVVGHTDYVSLVFVPLSELLSLLRHHGERLGAVRASVLVTVSPEGSDTQTLDRDAFEALVAAAHVTALLCSGSDLHELRLRIAMTLANDMAAEARLVTAGTKVLTQVARRGGVGAVVVELAHRLNGWAVLLDNHGQAITSAGAGALHLKDAVAVAFHRPVRVRHPGLQVHPVGEGDDLRAFLVVASRDGTTSRTRDLATQAAALLDLLLRTHDHSTVERLGRELMMATVLCESSSSPQTLLRRWGIRDDSLTGFVLSSRTKSIDLERLVIRWLGELGAPHTVRFGRDGAVGVIRNDQVEDLTQLIEESGPDGPVQLHCGIGSSTEVDSLRLSISEARQAHDVAVADNRPVVHYAALPTVRYLLKGLGPESLAEVARVLTPLRDADGDQGELAETLHVYLSEHGSWGVASQRLGVHRHTLKSRIVQIEKMTGLSMSNPDDRFAAWLALRAAGSRSITTFPSDR